MLGRLWSGRTTRANAEPYLDHLRTDTLPALETLDGFRGAFVLRRAVDGDSVEFLVLTLWESERAVEAFAGPDVERAVIPDAARRVLASWDERAAHYEVAQRLTDDMSA
jgi:heme-degrading monooxygenase HmoA